MRQNPSARPEARCTWRSPTPSSVCCARYTGRGPTKARTTIRDNVVLAILEQTLTKGEPVLVDKGRARQSPRAASRIPRATRDERSARVAELTGRNVVAMMSADHLNPDLGAEIFVLDAPELPDAADEAPEC
jgi:uncharacterized protein YbcI